MDNSNPKAAGLKIGFFLKTKRCLDKMAITAVSGYNKPEVAVLNTQRNN